MTRIRDTVAMWALDTNAADGATPLSTDLVPNYVRTWPTCGTAPYEIPVVGVNPTCPNHISDHVLGEE